MLVPMLCVGRLWAVLSADGCLQGLCEIRLCGKYRLTAQPQFAGCGLWRRSVGDYVLQISLVGRMRFGIQFGDECAVSLQMPDGGIVD